MYFRNIAVAAALCFWVSAAFAAEESHMPIRAETRGEITDYFQTGRIEAFNFAGAELLAVAHEVGSGLKLHMTYIYIGSDANGWEQLASHRSMAEEIEFRIDRKSDEFVVLSGSGVVLFKLPQEGVAFSR